MSQSRSCVTFYLLTIFALSCSVHAEVFQVRPEQRQLFLDDLGIEKIVQLKRILH